MSQKIDSSTYSHTHTHTLQHSSNVTCVAQTLCPHSNSNPKTAQTKKATILKPTNVVCNLLEPHPHKEQNDTAQGWIKKTLGREVVAVAAAATGFCTASCNNYKERWTLSTCS